MAGHGGLAGPGGVKQALLSDPTSARSGHICSLSLGSLQAFFKGDVMAVGKTRQRAAAMPSQLCRRLRICVLLFKAGNVVQLRG
jgi:hypothetical protein